MNIEAISEVVTLNLTSGLVFLLVFLIAYWVIRSQRKSSFPPGLPRLPLIGSLPWLGLPEDTFPKMAKKYGDVFSFYLFSRPVVVVWGYDNIKAALAKDQFADRPNMLMFEAISKHKGLASSNGSLWKEHRSFALRSLRDFGVGKRSLQGKILEEVNICINEIAKQNGQPYDIVPIIPMCVSNIFVSILFGQRYELDDPQFKRFLFYMNRNLTNMLKTAPLEFFPFLRYIPGDPFWFNTIMESINEVEGVFKESIEKCKKDLDANDIRSFLDAYLVEAHAQKDNPNSTFTTDDQLLKVLGDLFVAATDTTAVTLRWALLFLMEHPDVQTKAQREIDDVIGPDRQPCIEDKPKMPYMEACINEIQRHANILPENVPHAAREDVVFHGYEIPKGTLVMFPLSSALWDEAVFPNAREFNPEHFLNDDGSLRKIDQFLPFSSGRRVCIGEPLARMELFLFLSSFLQRFTFKTPDGAPVPKFPRLPTSFTKMPGRYKLCAIPR